MRYRTFEHRHAETILNSNLPLRREIERVFSNLTLYSSPGSRRRDTSNPHLQIQGAFCKRGWRPEVLVSSRTRKRQYFDLFKDRVAIEIEISSRERLYRDYLRFLMAELEGRIDLGILIVFDYALSQEHPAGLRSNLPRLEDVIDDLHSLRSVLGVPIWTVAIS